MTDKIEKPTLAERIHTHRLTITTTVVSALTVGTASAGDIFNGTGPILDDVILILPEIVDLVIAVVPVIIVLALVGFILGLFDGIIGKIKL